LESVLKFNYFNVSIGIKISVFRASVTIEPGRSLLAVRCHELFDLSILNESLSKMNELLEVLRVHHARIGLKINVKKTKLLRLGISEDEKLTSGKRSFQSN
jgi:hypothetical protein